MEGNASLRSLIIHTTTMLAVRLAILLLVLLALYRKRDGLARAWKTADTWLNERKELLARPFSPAYLTAILFVLFVCSLFLYARPLSALLLALFVVSFLRYLLHTRRERKRRGEAIPPDPPATSP